MVGATGAGKSRAGVLKKGTPEYEAHKNPPPFRKPDDPLPAAVVEGAEKTAPVDADSKEPATKKKGK